MGPGTLCKWDLKPGQDTLRASTEESSATVALDVRAGRIHYVEQNERLGLSSGRGHMKIRDAATGQKSIQGKKLLVSAYVPPE